MDHAEDADDDDDGVFIYMGGDQQVPRDVTHVRIHKSVKIISARAFRYCYSLVSIEMHDGVEIIEEDAFDHCTALRGIKLPGVRVIGESAFRYCKALTDVEFGDKLETIRNAAFCWTSLRTIKIPKVRVIGESAFYRCGLLTVVQFSEDLERIGSWVFQNSSLRRIAIPLKANLFDDDNVFYKCTDLSQVDLVGGIHKTVSSLLLERWRNDMNDEIIQINWDLPNTPTDEKNAAIRRWMGVVLEKIEHYKREHYELLKRSMTQLELALWKDNIDKKEEAVEEKEPAKKAKLNEECRKDASSKEEAKTVIYADRQQARVTCGANMITCAVFS